MLKSSYHFPIGIPSVWFAPESLPIPNEKLTNWLLNPGSLTERLVAQCSNFRLSVVGQKQLSVTQDEFQQISTPEQIFNEQDWLVREVVLWGDDKPWVFARSIIPMNLWQRDFTDLNNQPLGHRIFNDDRFKRLPFEITKIESFLNFGEQFSVSASHALWGRRSTFCFEQSKMMVCEVFLPDSPVYIKVDNGID
ncbi:chorismate--pyruvate lyase family protein [Paraglaciecola sp.]|uniref:chorismate--pyruvate lyase family protein n=1 Tax=Paraglaciecola sp. TaxID=1920173 RepID=UPI003EF9D88E